MFGFQSGMSGSSPRSSLQERLEQARLVAQLGVAGPRAARPAWTPTQGARTRGRRSSRASCPAAGRAEEDQRPRRVDRARPRTPAAAAATMKSRARGQRRRARRPAAARQHADQGEHDDDPADPPAGRLVAELDRVGPGAAPPRRAAGSRPARSARARRRRVAFQPGKCTSVSTSRLAPGALVATTDPLVAVVDRAGAARAPPALPASPAPAPAPRARSPPTGAASKPAGRPSRQRRVLAVHGPLAARPGTRAAGRSRCGRCARPAPS